jgi:hypothetical protein
VSRETLVLPATWRVKRDGEEGTVTLEIQLGKGYRVELTSFAEGRSSAIFYRDGEADRGFAGIGVLTVAEWQEGASKLWNEHIHARFSNWLDAMVLSEDAPCATWHVKGVPAPRSPDDDDDGWDTLNVQLCGDYSLSVTVFRMDGGASVSLRREGEANKGFPSHGQLLFAEWDIDVHESFSAWLDAMVLAQDGTP